MYPTIADTLELTAEKYPDKPGLIYPYRDQDWTYAEFDAKANQLANALLDLGVEKGDRVGTVLFNGSEQILTVFACSKIGAVFTPLNFRLPAGEIEFILNDAEADVVIYDESTAEAVEGARPDLETVSEYVYVDADGPEGAHGFYDLLEGESAENPGVDVAEDDVYAFMYTSGTTGRPKGVVHEHRDMIEHNLICIAEGGIRRDDVGLSALPLYHCAELQAALFPRIQMGATNVVLHEFDPVEVLQTIEAYDVSVFFGAPTAWNAMAQVAGDVDADTSSLRLGLYGAAPMPEEPAEEAAPLAAQQQETEEADVEQAGAEDAADTNGDIAVASEGAGEEAAAGKEAGATQENELLPISPDEPEVAAPETPEDRGQRATFPPKGLSAVLGILTLILAALTFWFSRRT